MSNKRTLQSTSPDYTDKNNYKKFVSCENMQKQNSEQDVFSWEKLCYLLDDKLKDVTRKSDLVAIKTDIEELKEENLKLKNDIKKLTSRIEFIDRRSRSANVIISGLNSDNVKAAKTEFLKLCSNELKVNVNVMSTRIISGGKSFCFTLETSMQAYNVTAAKKKLKGQMVYIQKDYTEEEQHVRYQLRKLSKNISQCNESVKVRLGEFCIFIDNNKFTWSNGKIVSNSANNAEYLSKLLAECNYPMEVTFRGGHKGNSEQIENPASQ